MDGDDEKKDGSDWAFSTETSSSNADNKDSATGVSAFSTDPAQNVGDRPLSNWGEEPRIDDSPPQRPSLLSSVFSRIFGSSIS